MSLQKVVILGPTGGRRVASLVEAAHRHGITDVTVVGFAKFAENPDAFARLLTPLTWLRFESPDGDVTAFRAAYIAGALEAQRQRYPVIRGSTLDHVVQTDGALGSPAQLVFGMKHLFDQAATLARNAGACMSSNPDEIMLSYDKTACSTHLTAAGIATPDVFDPPESSDQLLMQLDESRGRLFLKLRYGSGAAGTIAVAKGPARDLIAYTALRAENGAVLAGKTVTRITDMHQIKSMIDALIPLGLHAEAWVPKAGVDGKTCDLRLVVIPDQRPFSVLRMSKGPITNLHLDAERADADLLWRQMTIPDRKAVEDTAGRVMNAFPRIGMLGVDVAVLNDYRRHLVLEVNAFGDHVRHVTQDGLTPQDIQVRRMQRVMDYAH